MNTVLLVFVITGLHTPLWKLILLSAVLVSQVTVLLLWPHIGMLREETKQARSAQQGKLEGAPFAAQVTLSEPSSELVVRKEKRDDVLTHS
jgi:hypothetical protein